MKKRTIKYLIIRKLLKKKDYCPDVDFSGFRSVTFKNDTGKPIKLGAGTLMGVNAAGYAIPLHMQRGGDVEEALLYMQNYMDEMLKMAFPPEILGRSTSISAMSDREHSYHERKMKQFFSPKLIDPTK